MDKPDTVTISLRIPEHLWRAATMDKIDTKESLNALVVRLLQAYYPNRK